MKKTFLLFFLILSSNFFATAQYDLEKVEANLIYSFTKFFDWPQTEKSGDFIIGVFGSKELFNELKVETEGKKNVTQNIVVKHFDQYDKITKCHVIFVSSFKSDHITTIYKKTTVHCLIISNSIAAIEKGAAIQFYVEDNRLIYDFSRENALKHGLKFHSKIVEMAKNNY